MDRVKILLLCLVVSLSTALFMVGCGAQETTGDNTAQALSIKKKDSDGDYRLVVVNGEVPCIEYTGRPDGAGSDAYDLECDFTSEHFNLWVD